jgi:hypothetical protein
MQPCGPTVSDASERALEGLWVGAALLAASTVTVLVGGPGSRPLLARCCAPWAAHPASGRDLQRRLKLRRLKLSAAGTDRGLAGTHKKSYYLTTAIRDGSAPTHEHARRQSASTSAVQGRGSGGSDSRVLVYCLTTSSSATPPRMAASFTSRWKFSAIISPSIGMGGCVDVDDGAAC